MNNSSVVNTTSEANWESMSREEKIAWYNDWSDKYLSEHPDEELFDFETILNRLGEKMAFEIARTTYENRASRL